MEGSSRVGDICKELLEQMRSICVCGTCTCMHGRDEINIQILTCICATPYYWVPVALDLEV